jgi:serine/threonine protein kinase
MSNRRIGNYLISDYLGGGGFGSVFKAEDTSSPGRIVAIKELHKKHTRSAVIKQRFFQEAVAMARLDHVNLPRLYTFGEDNGSYYLVMEFLLGRLLTDEISDRQRLPLGQALTIICQVLEAVSYAHQNGIIHRDLKPDNIMLTGDQQTPKVKVLDFGIARMVGGENLTMAGEGFGTPAYMAPERIAGATDPDKRSDIYSLGIILYEMLAGKPPFASSATDPLVYWSEMRELHESQALPPLEGPGIPPEIDNIIRKATAKTAAYRYATADEMLAALLPVARQNSGAPVLSQSNPARLFLTTVPPAAEVYVDEKLYGASDAVSGKMSIETLSAGLHSVRVAKTGYSEYQISVVLEADKPTELQVPLAARATLVMSQAELTAPMDAMTVKIEGGEEVATAMLMLEGIPAGSQVFVGSKALALAGDDGRATIQLEPGVHELQVTTPSGKVGKRVVTLTQQDTGSLQTMNMPFAVGDSQPNLAGATSAMGAPHITDPSKPVAATTRMSQPQLAGQGSSTGKKAAMAAAVILLLALVASAYFVLRKPEPSPPSEVAAATSQTAPSAALTPPAGEPTKPNTPATNNAGTTAEREAIEREREKLEREKKALEKKEQEIAGKGASESEAPKKEPPAQEIPPPATPAEPAQPTPAGTACAAVRVIGPEGQPLSGVRVMFTGTTGAEARRTGPQGMCNVCGFPVGSKVRIMVFAMGVPTIRELTINPGRNGVEVRLESGGRRMPRDGSQASAQVDDGLNPAGPRRNKPFRKRPNY